LNFAFNFNLRRYNQAPVKTYEAFVGHKATFRVLNKKWTQQYSRGDKMWLPLEKVWTDG
jgi:hypothetical protein